MKSFEVREITDGDQDWMRRFIAKHWGAEFVVAHGAVYYPHALPGFVALQDGEVAGLVTYTMDGESCEIVSLDSLRPGQGIGTALVEAVKTAARRAGCRRLWLITTNDNLNALGFYQKRGFRIAAIHRNAVEEARKLKPIPRIGESGIPIMDEIEMEVNYVLYPSNSISK